MSAIVMEAIRKSLTDLLPSRMDTVSARLMMLTIQKQEDPEERRYQLVRRTAATAMENIVGPKSAKGPARSLWQMEAGGGIKGVLNHTGTAVYMRDILEYFGIERTPDACWHAVEDNDVLAACFARLLLWSDALKLPDIKDHDGAFELYLRTWRPGAYTRGDDSQKFYLKSKFIINHAAARREMNIQ